jgi:hypothetical protein
MPDRRSYLMLPQPRTRFGTPYQVSDGGCSWLYYYFRPCDEITQKW